MNPEWLAIQSFSRNQDLLTALNTLSIHTKLELSGHQDEKRAMGIPQARQTLVSFLEELERIVERVERAKDKPLLGVDPRLRQLAGSFVRARVERHRFRSCLFKSPLSDAVRLLSSTEETDRQALVECLAELRTLIEEHVQTDTARIFEDF